MSFSPLDDNFQEENNNNIIVQPASFWHRLLGYISDNVFVNCIVLAVGDLKIALCATILYISIELFTGASIGKRMMRLKIESTENKALDILDYAKRIGFKYSYFLIALLGIILQDASIINFAISFVVPVTVIASLFALRQSKLTLYDEWFKSTVVSTIGKAQNKEEA